MWEVISALWWRKRKKMTVKKKGLKEHFSAIEIFEENQFIFIFFAYAEVY